MSFKDLKKYFIKKDFKEDIGPDEIILDAEAIKGAEADEGSFDFTQGGSLERKLEVPINPKIFVLFFGLIVLVFSVFLIRAAELELFKGKKFQFLAERNRIHFSAFPARRGIIYDRFGTPLVKNIPSFDVLIDPLKLPKRQTEINILADKLSQIFDLSVDELKKELEMSLKSKFFQESLLIANIDHQKLLRLEPELKNLSGISIRKDASREYILAPYFSHINGYMGKIAPEDKEKHSDYALTEKIGRSGLEAQYEKVLRGSPGHTETEVNALGQEERVLNVEQPVAGQGLWLSVDGDLQKFLYEQLNSLDRRAIGVAVDPRNGQVLALVSLPSFDNNIFSKPISYEDFQKIINDPEKPLINRVISGEYPPGSTIKPFVAAAALEEKVVNFSTKINDAAGEIVIGDYRFGDWKVHGVTDIIKAIAESCNVFFYYLGGGYGEFQGLGIERIDKYLNFFGFNHSTGIDLPGERDGLVPNEKWKQDNKKEKWYIGDTYHIAIGQGDLLVTPIQLAMATAAVANNGILYQPQIVDKIVDSDKNTVEDIKPEILNKDFISPQNISIVREGMRQAVVAGSARSLSDLPVKVAGKTGTAQFGPLTLFRTHAWFTAFAPYDDPEIVLVILVEGGGEGSSIAVPIAKEVLSWYFHKIRTKI